MKALVEIDGELSGHHLLLSSLCLLNHCHTLLFFNCTCIANTIQISIFFVHKKMGIDLKIRDSKEKRKSREIVSFFDFSATKRIENHLSVKSSVSS